MWCFKQVFKVAITLSVIFGTNHVGRISDAVVQVRLKTRLPPMLPGASATTAGT